MSEHVIDRTAYKVTVTAECVQCGARREIGPGEVDPGDVPFCEKCYMPMVCVSATARRQRRTK
jgi:hypothetical protein